MTTENNGQQEQQENKETPETKEGQQEQQDTQETPETNPEVEGLKKQIEDLQSQLTKANEQLAGFTSEAESQENKSKELEALLEAEKKRVEELQKNALETTSQRITEMLDGADKKIIEALSQFDDDPEKKLEHLLLIREYGLLKKEAPPSTSNDRASGDENNKQPILSFSELQKAETNGAYK